jgi:hypothetical protein
MVSGRLTAPHPSRPRAASPGSGAAACGVVCAIGAKRNRCRSGHAAKARQCLAMATRRGELAIYSASTVLRTLNRLSPISFEALRGNSFDSKT